MPKSEQEIVEMFSKEFNDRFLEIAKQADIGNDKAYGKGLARLQTDIESFMLKLYTAGKENTVNELVEEFQRYSQFESCEVHDEDGNAMSRITCKNCQRKKNYISVAKAIALIKRYLELEKYKS